MQIMILPIGWNHRVIAAGIALAVHASSSAAQTRRNCEPGVIRKFTADTVGDAWAPHLPDVLLAAHAVEMGRGDYVAVVSAIAADADSVAKRVGVAAADWNRVSNRLDSLVQTLRVFASVPADRQPAFLAGTVRPADFQLNQGPTGDYPIFAGTPSEVVVKAAMTPDVQRALCWPAIAVDHVLTTIGARWRAETIAHLSALAGRWDNFISDGYSQFPWELAINSLLRRATTYEPPKYHWILLHPSLGAEVSGSSVKRLLRNDALVVEGLGLLRYNADHTRYLGVSAVTTLARGSTATVGVYAHLWYPQMAAGYAWRSASGTEARRTAVVSVDLYQFLDRVPAQLARARDSALGKKLLSLSR